MSNVADVTDADFDAEVLQSHLPVVVDFWADWCAPCKQLSPVVDELAGQYAGRVKVVKMDTNSNIATPSRFGVRNLPTVLVFSQGEIVKQLMGSVTKMSLRKVLDEVA